MVNRFQAWMPRIKRRTIQQPRWATRTLACCFVLLLGLTPGCGEDTEIVAYDAPKEPEGARQPPPFVQMVLDDSISVGEGVTVKADWVLPAGWSEMDPAPPTSAYAFEIASSQPEYGSALITTVTLLPGQGGGLLPNVNRWRRQLGLPPIIEPADQPQSLIEMTRAELTTENPTQAPNTIPSLFFDITSADSSKRTIAAIWPDPTNRSTWFFKLTGKTQAVGEQIENFKAVVASTRPLSTDSPSP